VIEQSISHGEQPCSQAGLVLTSRAVMRVHRA